MDKDTLIRVLLQRILAPSYLGTVLWIATDYLELAIGGFAVSVLFALAYPFLDVAREAWLGWLLQRQSQRRIALLSGVLPFLNAYVNTLTKYPPHLLGEAASAVSTQIAWLAQSLRPLKQRRLAQTADPYELLQAGALTPRAFERWSLAECQTWIQQMLDALNAGEIPALQRAVEHFQQHAHGHTWEACLAEAETELDRQAMQVFKSWRCVQQAQADPTVQQRLLTLLQLDDFHRQASLQTYLAGRPLYCTPGEVRDMMASLRYAPVAARLVALLEAAAVAMPQAEKNAG